MSYSPCEKCGAETTRYPCSYCGLSPPPKSPGNYRLHRFSTEGLIEELIRRGEYVRYVPMAADVKIVLKNPYKKATKKGDAIEALVKIK